MLHVLKIPRNRLLFMFGINTGLRIGDILPFKIKDIFNADGGFRKHVTVWEQKSSGPTKIPIDPFLYKDLLEYIEKYKLKPNDKLFKYTLTSRSNRDKDAVNLQFCLSNRPGFRHSYFRHITPRTIHPDQIILNLRRNPKPPVEVLFNAPLRRALKNYRKLYDLKPDDYLFFSQKGENTPIGYHQANRILQSAAKFLGIENFATHSMRKTFAYHTHKDSGDISLVKELLNHRSEHVTMRYVGLDQDAKDKAYKNLRYK